MLLATAGCPKKQVLARPDNARDALQLALEELEATRFKQAEEALTFVIFNFPGSRQASDAQYYLAECYFQSRDYIQAQTEYDFYLRSFPNGIHQEEATHRLALSYFYSAPTSARDQTRTLKAKEILLDFLARYPESELEPEVRKTIEEVDRRLARKDFDVALLYYKGGEFQSSLVYYQAIADRFPTDRWAPAERLLMAVCYARTGDPGAARPILEELASGDYPASIARSAADELSRLD